MASSFSREGPHVAQQTRRDKLRFAPAPPHHAAPTSTPPCSRSPSPSASATKGSSPPTGPAADPATSARSAAASRSTALRTPRGDPPRRGPPRALHRLRRGVEELQILAPAQQLLDEICSAVTGLALAKPCGGGDGQNLCDRVSGGGDASDMLSPLHNSSERGNGGGGSGTCAVQHRPEFQQVKLKLLFMQEEVCRRYKQYHQQVQMVGSSFESVAGLSSATPYASLALKTISKHFRSLKSAILNQLQNISKVLGEEFMLSPSTSKGEMFSSSRLKHTEQGNHKQKVGERSLGFVEHNQPVWRPQRGLPERAVAVLRNWLFDHFLHPYPTDTDKHMLAAQTGLSRNQVSNWFINARVRLWKPMVEEIHMLETKSVSGCALDSASASASRNDLRPTTYNSGGPLNEQSSEESNKLSESASAEAPFKDGNMQSAEAWHPDKPLRMQECGIRESTDGTLMSFMAYPSGMDIGGFGAVSLTLGLRHEAIWKPNGA
uniref:Homeobox domain-containing protein n=1 Tax=Ananas comosus var. bracteatus TaxID=296719 RepID=A0A6V7NRI3_ANACO|nr:unnamed protein product [Ananas comosus var. bracteatus]